MLNFMTRRFFLQAFIQLVRKLPYFAFIVLLNVPAISSSQPGDNLTIHFLVTCERLVKDAAQAQPNLAIENVRARFQDAETVLKETLPELAAGNPLNVFVGKPAVLDLLLFHSQVDQSVANSLKSFEKGNLQTLAVLAQIGVDFVIEGNLGNKTALGNTATRLKKESGGGEVPFVCILGKGSSLKFSPYGTHFSCMNGGFEIAPFLSQNRRANRPDRTDSIEVEVKEDLKKGISHFILMSGISNPQELVPWILSYFELATKFADFELLTEWIQANTALSKSGNPVDNLFDKVVWMTEDGVYHVDEGFLRLFLISRGNSARWMANSELATNFADLNIFEASSIVETREKHAALKDIRSFKAITEPVVRMFKLSEDNVFELGEGMGVLMMDTIENARTIRAEKSPH